MTLRNTWLNSKQDSAELSAILAKRQRMPLTSLRFFFSKLWSATKNINPRPAGVFGRTRPAGGGQILPPLPNSRTRCRSEVGEAANESS